MDLLSVFLGVSNIACGAICLLAALPLLAAKVGRNPYYGARFPESFRSEAAWVKMNRYGARRLIGWSAPMILVGIATLFVRVTGHPWAVWPIAATPLVVLIPAVECWRYARRFPDGA